MKPENCYPQELKMILSESNWLEKGKETYIFQGVAISYVSRTTEKETYRLYVCKRCSEIFGTLEVINSDVSENKSQYFKMKGE